MPADCNLNPWVCRPTAVPRWLAVIWFAAALGVWLVSCVSPQQPEPLRPGPTTEPDGEFRDLQTAIAGRNLGWVGQLLAPELLPRRRDLQVDGRRRLAADLVAQLAPEFERALVVTDKAVVDESYDARGNWTAATGQVVATLTPLRTADHGDDLESWFRSSPADDDLPATPEPARLVTEWRSDGEHWLLTGLRLERPDGRVWRLRPLLDPAPTDLPVPSRVR